MNPTLLRLLIVVALGGFAVLGFRVWKAWSLRESTRRVRAIGDTSQVSVMYFSGPNCAQCTAQEAVIRQIERGEPSVEFASYDASVDLEVASRVGVMSVPTTVIVDKTGRVHARNGRFVNAEILLTQIKAAKASSEPANLARRG
ncbi:MAG: thioredoxin family protein [Acidimicrobiia bacterium]|nr:thioredoxin family protein [Acidimicrobiia bacterium]